MAFTYKRASLEDINQLTQIRTAVLRAANKLPDDVDMTEVERQSCDYYQKALADKTHTAYLVFDQEILAGTGGISYYRVMPTYHNPSGNKAYIMNMYTNPTYRRKGIAYQTLYTKNSVSSPRAPRWNYPRILQSPDLSPARFLPSTVSLI